MHPKMAALRVGAAVAAFVLCVGWATAGTYAPLTEPQMERLFVDAPRPVASGDNSARDVSPSPAAKTSPQSAVANPDLPALTSLQPAPGAPSGPDTISDKVGATAGEFRVDESGAATYSIPLYAVPATAGVAPKLSLNYSSQGGNGPLGKGWSIGGLSAISRCRATREAGDFISGGVPVDGNPAPINFSNSDRYCLDGQRLIAISDSPACPAVSGMTVQQARTEIESFQRVCIYTPSGGANGPAYFTVQRRDGSISWYGDRDSNASANRPDGYFETNAPGHQAKALQWAQTRFQDSAGNYIDFIYWERVVNDVHEGEHLLVEVRYTGKVGSGAATPYAKLSFAYATVPAARGYQSGALMTRSRRLAKITSSVGSDTQVRHYVLDYDPSASGSGVDTLISVTECRDSTLAICLPATVFNWSTAKNEFAVKEYPASLPIGSASQFKGFKLGDIDGDSRLDLVWLKDGAGGCVTEQVMVAFSQIDSAGRQSFIPAGGTATCTASEIAGDDNKWALFDYNGDGRDDLFMSGGGGGTWKLYASLGRPSGADRVFDTTNLSPSISGAEPVHLVDLNGDGLLDVVYKRSELPDETFKARLMQQTGNGWTWGSERAVTGYRGSRSCTYFGAELYKKDGNLQLLDFDGDSRSDLRMQVTFFCENPYRTEYYLHSLKVVTI